MRKIFNLYYYDYTLIIFMFYDYDNYYDNDYDFDNDCDYMKIWYSYIFDNA